MEKKRTKRVDRISEMPESILHHILSFLPFKKVAQTSVLSKRWERVWCTYPVLEFGENVFGKYSNLYKSCKLNKDAQRRMKDLFNCVGEIMCNRHKDMISLTKFTLSLPLSDDREFTSFVNQCVCHAIGCNVNKLILLFSSASGEKYRYNLPQIVLFAKSLEILELQGCKVESSSSELNLSSLRKLTFAHVRIDGHMLKNLVSGCPLIEYLSFKACEGFKNMELFGLPRLDKIELWDNAEVERLDIKSPNVHSIIINGLAKTCDISLASCKNLTRLILFFGSITDEMLHSLISKLPVLQFLSIGSCSRLKNVKISSSCLEELDICELECNWIDLKIDTPNLRFLIYRGTMTSLSLNATALSKIKIYIHCENFEIQKYIGFLANFHHFSRALSLEIMTTFENVIIPEELRGTLSSPLSSPELLNLSFTITGVSIAKLVDGLLWIAPHTKTLSIRKRYSYAYRLSLEFTYKKQLIHEGETTSCCKSHPISCWDHCMEAVNVKFISEGFNSISCTLRGARIWEKIVALSDFWELLQSA